MIWNGSSSGEEKLVTLRPWRGRAVAQAVSR
jgi:hypothetical protein